MPNLKSRRCTSLPFNDTFTKIVIFITFTFHFKNSMTELKKIVNKVFILFLEVVLFSVRISKHIVFPNKKRKGNILCSLFVFFVGIIEILNHFEHGIFKMTKVFQQKNVRKGILITGVFLFLLSSFEWTKAQEFTINYNNTCTQQQQSEAVKSIPFNKAIKAARCLQKTFIGLIYFSNISAVGKSFSNPLSIKRYLFICSILI